MPTTVIVCVVFRKPIMACVYLPNTRIVEKHSTTGLKIEIEFV